MKVAVSAFEGKMEEKVNPVFGRCPGFVIAEVEGGKVKSSSFVENPAMSAGMGAGVAASQKVVEQGAEAVVTGNTGPNAFMVLQQSGVKVYRAAGQSVGEALKQLGQGKLEEMKGSNVAGHFGMQGAGAGRGAGRGMGAGRGAGFGSGQGAGRGAGRGPPKQ